MARSRKHRRSHRKHRRMLGNPQRHHRSHRRYHRNPPMGVSSALMAGLAALAGFAIVRKGGQLISGFLPAMIPQPDLVGELIAAAAVVAVAPMLARGESSKAAQSGAVLAGGIAVLNLTPVGPMLNLERVVTLPAPSQAAQAQALGGMLAGQLSADSSMEAYD